MTRQKPLGELFRGIAKNNLETTHIIKKLADTARMIDPDCPHGAHGVLSDLKEMDLSPCEINKLYRLCNNDLRYMNATIYMSYSGIVSKAELKKKILSGRIMPQKKALDHIRRGIKRPCRNNIPANHRFGQYLKTKKVLKNAR